MAKYDDFSLTTTSIDIPISIGGARSNNLFSTEQVAAETIKVLCFDWLLINLNKVLAFLLWINCYLYTI